MSRSVENEYLLAVTKQTTEPHEVNEKGIISDDDSSEIGYSVVTRKRLLLHKRGKWNHSVRMGFLVFQRSLRTLLAAQEPDQREDNSTD